jgi:hypothetical protein
VVTRRRAGTLLGLVVALAMVAALVLTAPWSADEPTPSGNASRVDVLTPARDLVGGKARYVGCKPHPHGRACELEGPTGKRATCVLFGEGEYSCFESHPRDSRR